MGTELQYAIAIDLLAANNFPLNNCVDDCTCDHIIMQNKEPNEDNSLRFQLRDSMDRVLDQHNAEFIRKTMLMHEAVFRQQVRELHRLHSRQRMLMEELKAESRLGRTETQASGPSTRIDEQDEAECGMDLTLSIGIGRSSSTSTTSKNKSVGCWESSSVNNDNVKDRDRGGREDCNAMSSSSNSGATVDQQQQQTKRTTSWLFQGFGLNDRT
ncbi:hypothetical protein Ancab_027787 [Ancistrocladus abbreviatus]